MKRKIISVIVALAAVVLAFPVSAAADEATVTVTVSVAGELKISAQQIKVTDIDNDGSLTINDALICAHDKYYTGGSAAGFESSTAGGYGLSIVKLWGDDSGAFGYYLNNEMVMTSLAETVKSGDAVNAYVYKDKTNWSDSYCFFDKESVSAKQGDSLEVTLKRIYFASYDSAPEAVPVPNAAITIDGVDTGIKTDAEGKAKITLCTVGELVISAVGDKEIILVPTVLKATVEAAATDNEPQQPTAGTKDNTADSSANNTSPKTGESSTAAIAALIAAAALTVISAKKLGKEQ